MAKLSDLKQNAAMTKESGMVKNPEAMKTLSKEDLRKLIPEKKEEGTPGEIINNELKGIDDLIKAEMEAADARVEKLSNESQEVFNDAVFDAPVEDIDTGLLSPEEADKELSKAFENATNAVKEDPSIKAGIEAVNNAANVTPENMDMDDFLKELQEDDSQFDKDDDESFDIKESNEDDDDDESEEEQKEMLRSMKQQVEDVIKPFTNVIDLKGFKIATRAKSAADVLKTVSEGPTATWVLLDSGCPFTCTSLGAVEIENLDPEKLNRQNGRIDALKQMYGTLFRHYASPNKPATLEEWLKTISFSDQDNLIFGYYKATFGQSNLITYACDKCKEVKIKNVPIEDCVKYDNDETKKEVENILKFGDTTFKPTIKSKLVQVSDTLAVSIKNPSIYNIVFEFGVLDADFTSKFADVLGTVGFIEDMYEIDVYNHQLIPIKVKEDPKNLTKSVKRRIRSKVEILKGLTPDQYNILLSEIAEQSKNSSRISYRQPEYTCEKCGNKIEEVEMSAQNLLFTRHQLALIKNLSIE